MEASTNSRQWTLEYPELATRPVPIEPCISPDYFELERQRIFRQVWLNVGRVQELPHVGDYFTKDLAVAHAEEVAQYLERQHAVWQRWRAEAARHKSGRAKAPRYTET